MRRVVQRRIAVAVSQGSEFRREVPHGGQEKHDPLPVGRHTGEIFPGFDLDDQVPVRIDGGKSEVVEIELVRGQQQQPASATHANASGRRSQSATTERRVQATVRSQLVSISRRMTKGSKPDLSCR